MQAQEFSVYQKSYTQTPSPLIAPVCASVRALAPVWVSVCVTGNCNGCTCLCIFTPPTLAAVPPLAEAANERRFN